MRAPTGSIGTTAFARIGARSGLYGFVVALLGFCACAKGLGNDSAPTEKPAPVAPNDAAPAPGEDSSSPETSEPVDAGVDADEEEDASPDAPVVVSPPTVNGVIASGEYGVHTDGQNRQTSTPADPTSTTWYMTWTETNLYIGVTAANVAEGLVIYLDDTPLTPSTSGTNADGSLAGVLYDGAKIGALPFRADFVAYVKASYNDYRKADGANAWSVPTVGSITVQGTGTTRELVIPWSTIRAGGRPSSFLWLGYIVSPTGYVYGEMPSDNAAGTIGTNATFAFFYKVTNATPGTGTKPFATKLIP